MRITLNLLREGMELSKSALRDGASFKEVVVVQPSDEGVFWKLFVRPMPSKPAAWTKNVVSIVTDLTELAGLRTQSSAGVLLIQVDGRVFAVTFGAGYHAVSPASVEPSFGLKVTANVVTRDKVTSADTKGFNQSARSQKTVMPSAGEFAALGVEPTEEWVRQMSGKVGDESFASTASGADSLHLGIKEFSMLGLPEKLKQILNYYERDTYKNDFGFLDNFTRLAKRDPLVVDLDARLGLMVSERDPSLAFAAPDPFEQLKVHHYRIQYRKHRDLEELLTDDVYEVLKFLNVSNDPLRRVSVRALNEDGDDIDRKYDLYDYVQVEIDHSDGHRYALTSGAWFRIDRNYLNEIEAYVAALDDVSDQLTLEDWRPSELTVKKKDDTAEGLYNENLAKLRSWALLDKKNLLLGGYRKIEICDLLTPERQLLCVKRASKSSTLSHLFAQANVSASLMHEPRYQDRLMEALRTLRAEAAYGQRGDWTFVYAIATSKPGRLSKSLFFFSKVNLVTAARGIVALGYKVALARIEVVEET